MTIYTSCLSEVVHNSFLRHLTFNFRNIEPFKEISRQTKCVDWYELSTYISIIDIEPLTAKSRSDPLVVPSFVQKVVNKLGDIPTKILCVVGTAVAVYCTHRYTH